VANQLFETEWTDGLIGPRTVIACLPLYLRIFDNTNTTMEHGGKRVSVLKVESNLCYYGIARVQFNSETTESQNIAAEDVILGSKELPGIGHGIFLPRVALDPNGMGY
jgi:hypothetical protein